jgi:hypothetical protein
MDRPIYKLCLIRGYTEAYYQLSEAEKQALWDELLKALTPLGVKKIGPYYDCGWSNDVYEQWFIMKYPNIEAAIADTHECQRIGLNRYMVSETILGIEQEGPDMASSITE